MVANERRLRTVLTQIRGPHPHFNPFYEDNSILIQFIVEEFIQSHQLIFRVNTLIQEHLDSAELRNFLSHSLIQLFRKLSGPLSQQEGSIPSQWTKGSLIKLKEYCRQFSLNSSHQNKRLIFLHRAAQQAGLLAIDCLELLTSLYTNLSTPNSEYILFLPPLKRSLYNLKKQFNQIRRYIPRILHDYWDNEHVLYYLLSKKKLLTEIYGDPFFEKYFKWPNQTSELMEWLIQRHQVKGFEALLPSIQNFFEVGLKEQAYETH